MKYANERREKLMRLLMLNEKCSMENLAEILEVSTRTIERDLHFLSATKPICIDQGRYGGVYLLNRKNIHMPSIEEKELGVLQKIVSEVEQTGT